MVDLARWLGQQFDVDDRLARAALGSEEEWWWGPDAESPAERHVAAHGPARVLREIDAKRRIVGEHTVSETSEFEGKTATITYCPICRNDGECPTLRLLALPYADRPGYREEWAP